MTIIEFTSPEDAFPITGRGMAYTSSKWITCIPEDMWDPCDLSGTDVILCGEVVKVMGVETFAIPRSQSSPYRHSFGLLVSFTDAERINYVPNRSRNRPQT